MRVIEKIFDWKTYILTALAVISFQFYGRSCLVKHTRNSSRLFQDCRRVCCTSCCLCVALTWLLRPKPTQCPKQYSVVVFDVFGQQTTIDGIRTEFKTYDVAWSFMKQYKKAYPMHNFAMVSKMPKSDKPTIFKYI